MRKKAYDGRWWEWQANRAIGGLLLPKNLVNSALEGMLAKSAVEAYRRHAVPAAPSALFRFDLPGESFHFVDGPLLRFEERFRFRFAEKLSTFCVSDVPEKASIPRGVAISFAPFCILVRTFRFGQPPPARTASPRATPAQTRRKCPISRALTLVNAYSRPPQEWTTSRSSDNPAYCRL